ncbi:fasciclin domain-containing protein [Persicobacter psychrovividus]|uniref:FAS1 domain-containing protein n=1 Tax=Persicobacter psychrovividus TaxID=387638 RepID=A0ABN6L7H0_9BACT|nr:hypothetical protein PEPS_14300 [Persicobacter psychrovividus]
MKLSKLTFPLLLLLMAVTVFTSCKDDDDDNPTPPQVTDSILDEIKKDADLSTLLDQASQFSDIADLLDDDDQTLTLFAPTNDAFTKFLEANPDVTEDQVKATLQYHVLTTTKMLADLKTGDSYLTAQGESITVTKNDGLVVMLNDSIMITKGDIEATNGVMHKIDMVLTIPEEDDEPAMTIAEIATGNENFSTLVAAVSKFDDLTAAISSPDSDLTVFAPTNDAFQALLDSNPDWNSLDDIDEATLKAVLTYHIVEGSVFSTDLSDGRVETLNGKFVTVDLSNGVMIDDANVIIPDVEASNGVVHAIDAVLIPKMNLVETAIATPDLSTLVAAVSKYPDLVTALSDESAQLTVFAPTNDAFQALLDSNPDWNSLDDIDEATLKAVLTYHVAGAKILSSDLQATNYTMLDGNTISVNLDNGVVINGSSTVVIPDVMASNGVAHVIDMVLLP